MQIVMLLAPTVEDALYTGIAISKHRRRYLFNAHARGRLTLRTPPRPAVCTARRSMYLVARQTSARIANGGSQRRSQVPSLDRPDLAVLKTRSS
jgi:hypothetical protein